MSLDCDNCGPKYTEEFTVKWALKTEHLRTLSGWESIVSPQFTSPQGHIWAIEAKKVDTAQDEYLRRRGSRFGTGLRTKDDLRLQAKLVKIANCTSPRSHRAAIKYRFIAPQSYGGSPSQIVKHPTRLYQGDSVEKLLSYSSFANAIKLSGGVLVTFTVWMEEPITAGDLMWKSHATKQKFEAVPGLLKMILNDPEFADAKIKVGSASFPVHRCILAGRSKVFSSMFTSGMQESRDHEVEINDFEPDIVKTMIDYMYTGEITDFQEKYYDVLEIADKYELLELKDVCEKYMLKNLNVTNAGRALECAYQRNLGVLPQVVEFVNKYRKEVAKTDEGKAVFRRNPDLLIDLYVESGYGDW